MKTGAAAQRYAKAVFSLGVDSGEFERIGQEIGAVVEAIDTNDALRMILLSPQHDAEVKRGVVEAIASKKGFTSTTKNFLLLLVDKGRLPLLQEMYRSYQKLSDEKAGRMNATVVTASQLTEQLIKEIVASLEKKTGKKVSLSSEVDPALIGGVVIKIGDIIYDGSIKTQLNKLRDNIRKTV
ncbi:MAG: ATP synthase F1 subunit delta [Deltaproteobacteria bacterium]|nr:ATP synthase F1 subunit delta [Deltaproteobacteria bacterium]